jgi:transcriptional regulator with XRE-family HTH domain
VTERPRASNILRKVGGAVRRLREERQLSRAELAHLADSNERFLGGVERGEKNISVVNLCYVAAVLQVAPSELLSAVTAEDVAELPAKPRKRPGRATPRKKPPERG